MNIYISKEQYEKLKKELEYLRLVEIKKIAERIKTAREFGDISENAEYEIAINEKENLERKIIEIDNILKTAKIIKNTKNNKNSNKILPGNSFQVLEKNNKKKSIFTLVGFGESDPLKNKISTNSPLGKAFLNKKVGDIVKVQTPKGEIIYEILKIINN